MQHIAGRWQLVWRDRIVAQRHHLAAGRGGGVRPERLALQRHDPPAVRPTVIPSTSCLDRRYALAAHTHSSPAVPLLCGLVPSGDLFWLDRSLRIHQRPVPHVWYAVLSAHAHRMLIGACNPMPCSIHVFRRPQLLFGPPPAAPQSGATPVQPALLGIVNGAQLLAGGAGGLMARDSFTLIQPVKR